ncbi:hypothetical protein ACP275_05G092000 [Erythranthe tilingii]
MLRPNPPSYKLVHDAATDLLLLSPLPHHENGETRRLPTRRGTEIVALYVRHPMANSILPSLLSRQRRQSGSDVRALHQTQYPLARQSPRSRLLSTWPIIGEAK